MASVQQQEGYFRDLVERLVHQFEGRAHYDDEVAIIREAREALAHNETTEAVNKPDSAPQTGNAAAMREALVAVKQKLSGWWEWLEVENVVEEALAKPLRNCDIYDAVNGAAECMQAIDAAWHEIDTIRATIGWMLAPVDTKGADDGI